MSVLECVELERNGMSTKCPDCDGKGYRFDDARVRPCPRCRPEEADDDEASDRFDDKFGKYRLNGGISRITFENPVKGTP
jgi:hypothetical protein